MLSTNTLYSLRARKGSGAWLVPTVVFCGAVVLAVLFAAVLPDTIQIDESSDYVAFYEPVARSIAAGRGLVLPDGSPATECPPGFPLLLAGVYKFSTLLQIPEDIGVRLLALTCVGLASVFLFALATDFWLSRFALLVAALWMTYPFALWLTKQLNSELPFLAVLYGGFALLGRNLIRRASAWPYYFVSGLLIGGSALIRPIAIGIGVVCAVLSWLSLHKLGTCKKLALVGCLIFGNLAAIIPWEIWVFQHTGRVILLSTSGTSSIRDGLSFASDAKNYRQGIPVPADVRLVMDDVALRARQGELESLSDVASVLGQQLRTHPLATIELLLLKIARSWYGTDSGRYETSILFIQFIYLALIAMGGWQIWKRGTFGRQLVVGTLTVTLYFWVMTAMALSILRYMVPAIGLLFLLVPGAFSRQGAIVKDPNGG